MHPKLRQYLNDILSGVYYNTYKTHEERVGRALVVINMSDYEIQFLIKTMGAE